MCTCVAVGSPAKWLMNCRVGFCSDFPDLMDLLSVQISEAKKTLNWAWTCTSCWATADNSPAFLAALFSISRMRWLMAGALDPRSHNSFGIPCTKSLTHCLVLMLHIHDTNKACMLSLLSNWVCQIYNMCFQVCPFLFARKLAHKRQMSIKRYTKKSCRYNDWLICWLKADVFATSDIGTCSRWGLRSGYTTASCCFHLRYHETDMTVVSLCKSLQCCLE